MSGSGWVVVAEANFTGTVDRARREDDLVPSGFMMDVGGGGGVVVGENGREGENT